MKTVFYIFLLMCSSVFVAAQVHVTPPNGDVGIGTETPTGKLTVISSANKIGMESRSPHGNTHFPFSNGWSYISGKGVIFRTGSTERMRIRTDGNVGIGATNPVGKLIVNGLKNKIGIGSISTHGKTYLPFADGNSYISGKNIVLRANATSGNTERMRIASNGRVGIGTNTPQYKLHVNGSIGHNGSIDVTSDKRLKQNESKFDYGLEEVLNLSPIYYNYNGKAGTNTERTHVGLYAQELKKTAPKLVGEFTYQEVEIVEEDEDGMEVAKKVGNLKTYLNINESAIKYMLINAVKEQQTIIEELQKEVSELRDIVENGSSPRTGSSPQSLELEGREPSLKQNTPNPFSSRTLVEYYVPADTKRAEVRIYDSNGKLMQNKSISGTGEGNIQVEARTIPAGTYNYSLVVDGKVIDTKQMVIIQ